MSGNERGYRWQEPVDDALIQPGDEGFLSRWSRRKRLAESGVEEPDPTEAAAESDRPAPVPVAAEAIGTDDESGKSIDDLTDEDMPPLDQIDAFSDVSMFMSKNVSAALRMKALSRVFHSSRYNQVCLCAEYAEDYTQFAPLGDVVPHDLKAAIAREAERLRERLSVRGEELSQEEAEARITAERQAGVAYTELDSENEEIKEITRSEAEWSDGAESVAVENAAIPRG